MVTVRQLVNYFGYRHLVGDDNSLDRIIEEGNVNRPGLELSGYLEDRAMRRLVIIGEKETNYIKTMSSEMQYKVFDYLTSDAVPMILISRDLQCPEILREIAEKKNFPILSSYAPTSSLMVEIVSYLEEFFAPVESIHGVLLQVYGRGVLIRGESGMGKSEIALELVKKGHILVADDRVDVYRLHNTIKGTAPDVLKNMLEIRGIGIIDVSSMFGAGSTTEKTQIDFIIDLKRWDRNEEYERIGLTNQQYEQIFGISIPRISIPVSEGRSIAVIVEAAVTNYILKLKGMDSSEIIRKRLLDQINKNRGE